LNFNTYYCEFNKKNVDEIGLEDVKPRWMDCSSLGQLFIKIKNKNNNNNNKKKKNIYIYIYKSK